MKKTPSGIPALAILSVCITLTITPAWADDLKVFSNGSVADANDVNANFTELETRIETISLTPGETGAVGAQGIQGNQGLTGVAGATGAQGLPGNTGATGSAGVQGIRGGFGETGAQGAQGSPGETGEQGETGAESTVAGPPGEAGTPNAGTNGIVGEMQYWDGNEWLIISPAVGDSEKFYFCDNKPTWDENDCTFYSVGDRGPAGGWVISIEGEGLHGVEVGLTELSGGSGSAWGCDDSILVDGEFNRYDNGGGQENTILVSDYIDNKNGGISECDNQVNAFTLAVGYELNGYTDWYLWNSADFSNFYNMIQSTIGYDGFEYVLDEKYWMSYQDSEVLAQTKRVYVYETWSGSTTLSESMELKSGLYMSVAVRAF